MGWDNKLSLHIHMHNVSTVSSISMGVEVNGELGGCLCMYVLYVRTYTHIHIYTCRSFW